MIIFVIMLLLVVFPARGEEVCFNGQPSRVTFDNGHVVKILSRSGEEESHTVQLPDGREAISATHLLMFPRSSTVDAKAITYDWKTPLPGVAGLAVGAHFRVQAVENAPEMTPREYRIDGRVLRDDVVAIGACSYPVRVIDTKLTVGGKAIAETVTYLNLDMLVSLRTEGKMLTDGKTYVFQVTALK